MAGMTPLTMAGMNSACNCVQAMPRYFHQIERQDKLASVPHEVRGEETHNYASVPHSSVRGLNCCIRFDFASDPTCWFWR